MCPRISIWGSVRLSVGLSVRRSVGDAFVKNKENNHFWANNYSRRYSRRISCNHIIIQSFHHHEDASLALWALFLGPTVLRMYGAASRSISIRFVRSETKAVCMIWIEKNLSQVLCKKEKKFPVPSIFSFAARNEMDCFQPAISSAAEKFTRLRRLEA